MAEWWVAELKRSRAFLAEAEPAAWLWARLRAQFPVVLAAVVLPTRFEVLTPNGAGDRERIRHLLAAFSRRFAASEPWRPLLASESVATRQAILDRIRTIHTSPCRPLRIGKRTVTLAVDPLAWEWSTHRDLVGAVADPWVTPAQLMPLDTPDDPQWWHLYIAKGMRSRCPVPAPEPTSDPFSMVPLGRVLDAVAAATRTSTEDVRRRGPCRAAFIDLARHQRWTKPGQLAQIAGITTAGLRRAHGRSAGLLFEAARLCLGDDRLRIRTSYTPPSGLERDERGEIETSSILGRP